MITIPIGQIIFLCVMSFLVGLAAGRRMGREEVMQSAIDICRAQGAIAHANSVAAMVAAATADVVSESESSKESQEDWQEWQRRIDEGA